MFQTLDALIGEAEGGAGQAPPWLEERLGAAEKEAATVHYLIENSEEPGKKKQRLRRHLALKREQLQNARKALQERQLSAQRLNDVLAVASPESALPPDTKGEELRKYKKEQVAELRAIGKANLDKNTAFGGALHDNGQRIGALHAEAEGLAGAAAESQKSSDRMLKAAQQKKLLLSGLVALVFLLDFLLLVRRVARAFA